VVVGVQAEAADVQGGAVGAVDPAEDHASLGGLQAADLAGEAGGGEVAFVHLAPAVGRLPKDGAELGPGSGDTLVEQSVHGADVSLLRRHLTRGNVADLRQRWASSGCGSPLWGVAAHKGKS